MALGGRVPKLLLRSEPIRSIGMDHRRRFRFETGFDSDDLELVDITTGVSRSNGGSREALTESSKGSLRISRFWAVSTVGGSASIFHS